MADLSFAKAYRDEILSNISIEYTNSEANFVANKIAPFVKVQMDSGKIYNDGKQGMRIVNDQRAIGGSYEKVKYFTTLSDHYRLNDYGLMGEIVEEDVRNSESPLNIEAATTKRLTSQLMLGQEKRLASQITTSTITNNVTLSGTSKWSDYSGTSNPFVNIDAGITSVAANTGKMANNLVLSWDAMMALKNHPAVKARFPGKDLITNSNVIDALGAVFGIQNVRVASARELKKNMPQDGTLDLLWANLALVYYSEPTPELQSVSFAKTYARSNAWEVVKLTAEDLKYQAMTSKLHSAVRVSLEYDQVIVDAGAAYLITGTNS